MSNGEMIGKGRSFAPATLAHLAHDEEDGVFESAVSNFLVYCLTVCKALIKNINSFSPVVTSIRGDPYWTSRKISILDL